MNNLSILHAPYMQNYIIDFMTEIPSVSKKENFSWRDIQGLSWTLEEPSFELNDKFSTYAQT